MQTLLPFRRFAKTTYDNLRSRLGSSWDGEFKDTLQYNQWGGTPDDRCGPLHAPWGVVLLAHSGVSSRLPIALPLGSSETETRVMLCGNTTIGVGFRICTTHLSVSSQNVAQSNFIADQYLDGWAANDNATVLGGDFNINVRSCSGATNLTQQYHLYFGFCGNFGYGPNHEADAVTDWGDTDYNEETLGLSSKFDYTFFNFQRFNTDDYGADATDSTVSDHNPLRSSITVHS